MKTNLRNDKEKLRVIKNNFVYLDHANEEAKPLDFQQDKHPRLNK
jgi:hypothetical protein